VSPADTVSTATSYGWASARLDWPTTCSVSPRTPRECGTTAALTIRSSTRFPAAAVIGVVAGYGRPLIRLALGVYSRMSKAVGSADWLSAGSTSETSSTESTA
jgi:hypothetical protein